MANGRQGRTLRVAVIGAGAFAPHHLEAWRRIDGVELIAICDPDAEAAQAAALRFSIAKRFRSARSLLEAALPHLVDIVTPPESHRELIRAAAANGVHALCETPLCGGYEAAREAVAAAAEAGTMLAVHESVRFEPWHRAARALIDDGALGDIRHACFRYRPGRAVRESAQAGGDPVSFDGEAVHFVDLFRYLLGEVRGVFARTKRFDDDAGDGAAEACAIMFDFAGGAGALYDADPLIDHGAADLGLTRGEMLIEGTGATLRLDGDGGLHLRPIGETGETPVGFEWRNEGVSGDSIRTLQEHVAAHLLRRSPLETRAADYLDVLRIEEAIRRSAESGRYETL